MVRIVGRKAKKPIGDVRYIHASVSTGGRYVLELQFIKKYCW